MRVPLDVQSTRFDMVNLLTPLNSGKYYQEPGSGPLPISSSASAQL
jgi:hypothetical protein